ncbi:hypothetical protein ABE527_21080 [Brucella sp. TWI432]
MSDPQVTYKLWLKQELGRRPRGTKGALAKFLGVSADAITRMANTENGKEAREIKAHELPLIQKFFSEQGAEPEPLPSVIINDGPIRGDQAIIDMLKRIEGLDQRGVEVVFSVIDSVIQRQPSKSKPSSVDDLPESAKPHRELKS